MRKVSSYSVLTLGGLLLAGSCSIIAEVDRTKIPQDGDQPEGGQGSGGTSGTGGTTGGTSGTGGKGGTAGTDTGGTSGSGGTSGEGGMGGEPGGMGGEDMGGAGSGGTNMGGEGGMPGPECGNGVVESGEQCDDDGTATGDGCNATCQRETGWTCNNAMPTVCTPVCGDGVDIDGAGNREVCDDGNSLACGTCAGNATGSTSGCAAVVAPTAATGSITPVTAADLDDGTNFVLNDGYHPAITFEFDSDASVVNSATLIGITYSAATADAALQSAIISAIDGVTTALFIDASPGSSALAVTLTHDRTSSLGTQAITKGGPNAGADVSVSGMTGGLAGNCPATTPCRSDSDCASLDCNSSNLCTSPTL